MNRLQLTRPLSVKKKISEGLTGKRKSQESKQKTRETMLRRWKERKEQELMLQKDNNDDDDGNTGKERL